jgi:hypothetical protein
MGCRAFAFVALVLVPILGVGVFFSRCGGPPGNSLHGVQWAASAVI